MDIWAATAWWLTALGALVGVVALAYGYVQARRADTEHKRRQETLKWLIDRANYVKFEHEIIEDLVARNDDPLLARWLWLLHQAGCDLYLTAVDQFLAAEKKFTFADLEKIAQSGLVGGQWQYRYWVSKIALRPENRGVELSTPDPQFGKRRVERHFMLRTPPRPEPDS